MLLETLLGIVLSVVLLCAATALTAQSILNAASSVRPSYEVTEATLERLALETHPYAARIDPLGQGCANNIQLGTCIVGFTDGELVLLKGNEAFTLARGISEVEFRLEGGSFQTLIKGETGEWRRWFVLARQ